jgi:hypothetical protein
LKHHAARHERTLAGQLRTLVREWVAAEDAAEAMEAAEPNEGA